MSTIKWLLSSFAMIGCHFPHASCKRKYRIYKMEIYSHVHVPLTLQLVSWFQYPIQMKLATFMWFNALVKIVVQVKSIICYWADTTTRFRFIRLFSRFTRTMTSNHILFAQTINGHLHKTVKLHGTIASSYFFNCTILQLKISDERQSVFFISHIIV